jgi:hypothetical protein
LRIIMRFQDLGETLAMFLVVPNVAIERDMLWTRTRYSRRVETPTSP